MNSGCFEVQKMTSAYKTETIALRCQNCNRLETAPARFCRWCGFSKRSGSIKVSGLQQGSTTRVLECEEDSFEAVSRRPLDTLAQSVAETTGSLKLNRYGALFIAVLTAIPMWLLIILLSPFDAYVRAKATWGQIVIR